VYNWANGDTFSGFFKDGKKHGHGKWIQPEAEVKVNKFEGQY